MKTHPLTRAKKQKAVALLQAGQYGQARALLEKVCAADRRDAEAWYLLGAAHQHLDDHFGAETSYVQALALHPDHAETLYHLGFAQEMQGKLEQAVASYRHALEIEPDHIRVLCNLGLTLQALGKPAEAAGCYEQALRRDPAEAILHFNLSNALRELGQHETAAEHYRSAIRLKPDYAEAYINLGSTLIKLTQLGEAVTSYRRALEVRPAYAAAHYGLANLLRRTGRLAEAIEHYRRVVEIEPSHANAHFNLATSLLAQGEFRAGWQEYIWHWHRDESTFHAFEPTSWELGDLHGRRVFLLAEQGLGDELFFLRFAQQLKQRGASEIVYQPGRKIASLLVHVPLFDRLAGTDERPTSGDLVYSIGDLPRLLGMERGDQIPAAFALTPLSEQLDAMRRRLTELGPPPYVGVTWRAGMPDRELRLFKECPLPDLARVLRQVPGTVLVLQRQPAEGEIGAFARELNRPAHDLSALNDDLEQMLALLSLIDEYVGVSNTNMHLRAGVGKTARVLVPAPPEWRWMAEGKESPWFPGFTVYRQGYDGGWEDGFSMLNADLIRAFEQ